MKLFKTICAAFTALALGTTALAIPSSAAASTPEEIAAAYDEWQDSIGAYNDAVAAYEAELANYQAAWDLCWNLYVNYPYSSDDMLTCRRDVEYAWDIQRTILYDEILFTESEMWYDEGYYNYVLTH